MQNKFLFIVSLLVLLSCNKEKSAPIEYGTLTDQDGNSYKTVKIGTQVWMAENLKTVTFCNGDSIPKIVDGLQWNVTSEAMWSVYDMDMQNEEIYGKLYNWYAAIDERNICPCGWHVADDQDWFRLRDFLGGSLIAGSKMKIVGTEYGFPDDERYSSNESGFSALPSGVMSFDGSSHNLGEIAYFWIACYDSIDRLFYKSVEKDSDFIGRDKMVSKNVWSSIRCVKN